MTPRTAAAFVMLLCQPAAASYPGSSAPDSDFEMQPGTKCKYVSVKGSKGDAPNNCLIGETKPHDGETSGELRACCLKGKCKNPWGNCGKPNGAHCEDHWECSTGKGDYSGTLCCQGSECKDPEDCVKKVLMMLLLFVVLGCCCCYGVAFLIFWFFCRTTQPQVRQPMLTPQPMMQPQMQTQMQPQMQPQTEVMMAQPTY